LSGNYTVMRYYAARSGNFLRTFRENLSVPSSKFKYFFLNPEDGTDKLSRNVGKKITNTLYAVTLKISVLKYFATEA